MLRRGSLRLLATPEIIDRRMIKQHAEPSAETASATRLE
jgi:hypothetical protein